MKRKVALIGPSTYMVSLPSKWAKENNVKKGDEVEVEAKDKELIISTEKKLPEVKRLDLEEKEVGHFHKYLLAYLYHKGYDEIRISLRGRNASLTIQERMDQLIGYEVVSETDKSITIKSVSEPNQKEFDSILRRIFLIQLEMSSSCYDAFLKADYDLLGKISLMESTNNRLTDYCKRMINKFGYKERENTTFIYVIIRDLERLADMYKDLCFAFFREDSYKLPKQLLDMLNETNYFFRFFYELYYSFNPEKISEFFERKDKMKKAANLAMLKSKGKETIFLHILAEIQNTIFELYGPYYTMKI